jgi:hypothetical protein
MEESSLGSNNVEIATARTPNVSSSIVSASQLVCTALDAIALIAKTMFTMKKKDDSLLL